MHSLTRQSPAWNAWLVPLRAPRCCHEDFVEANMRIVDSRLLRCTSQLISITNNDETFTARFTVNRQCWVALNDELEHEVLH